MAHAVLVPHVLTDAHRAWGRFRFGQLWGLICRPGTHGPPSRLPYPTTSCLLMGHPSGSLMGFLKAWLWGGGEVPYGLSHGITSWGMTNRETPAMTTHRDHVKGDGEGVSSSLPRERAPDGPTLFGSPSNDEPWEAAWGWLTVGLCVLGLLIAISPAVWWGLGVAMDAAYWVSLQVRP